MELLSESIVNVIISISTINNFKNPNKRYSYGLTEIFSFSESNDYATYFVYMTQSLIIQRSIRVLNLIPKYYILNYIPLT